MASVAAVIDVVIAPLIIDGVMDTVKVLFVNLARNCLTAAIPPFTMSKSDGYPAVVAGDI